MSNDAAIEKPARVLIAGFGLGGAAFALALARKGVESLIFESRNEGNVAGKGRAINLSPNGCRVLDQLGVWDEVSQHGTLFDTMYVVKSNGGAIGGLHIGSDTKYGYRACGIWRSEVHEAMTRALEATGKCEIRYNTRVQAVHQDEHSVSVDLSDGRTETGDWLIGCDGVRSVVRKSMFGEDLPIQYEGMLAVDGIADLGKIELEKHHIPPNAMIFGQSGAGGFYQCGDASKGEKVTMWSVMMRIPERDRAGWKEFVDSGEALETAKERIKGWGSPMETLLQTTDNASCTLWPFYWVPKLPHWHSGRCVLMGDAAHAMPPFAGQGTAQALEDAMVLSRIFTEGGTFEAYERERCKRTEGIRTMTSVAGAWFQPTDSWLAYNFKMYSLMLTIPYSTWRGNDGIYNYDGAIVPVQ